MRRIIIISLLILLDRFSSNGQNIIKILIFDTTRDGYGVEMYYYIENIDMMIMKLKKINSLKEKNLLEAVGIPIINKYDIMDTCICCSENNFNLRKFFKKNKPLTLKLHEKTISITISVLGIHDVSICLVDLYHKVWLSYDAIFEKAVFINSTKVKTQRISHIDRAKLNKLRNFFNN